MSSYGVVTTSWLAQSGNAQSALQTKQGCPYGSTHLDRFPPHEGALQVYNRVVLMEHKSRVGKLAPLAVLFLFLGNFRLITSFNIL